MIFRGVPLPSMFFFSLPVGTLDLLFGGGGGIILFGDSVFMFCLSLFWFCCFGFSSI